MLPGSNLFTRKQNFRVIDRRRQDLYANRGGSSISKTTKFTRETFTGNFRRIQSRSSINHLKRKLLRDRNWQSLNIKSPSGLCWQTIFHPKPYEEICLWQGTTMRHTPRHSVRELCELCDDIRSFSDNIISFSRSTRVCVMRSVRSVHGFASKSILFRFMLRPQQLITSRVWFLFILITLLKYSIKYWGVLTKLKSMKKFYWWTSCSDARGSDLGAGQDCSGKRSPRQKTGATLPGVN